MDALITHTANVNAKRYFQRQYREFPPIPKDPFNHAVFPLFNRPTHERGTMVHLKCRCFRLHDSSSRLDSTVSSETDRLHKLTRSRRTRVENGFVLPGCDNFPRLEIVFGNFGMFACVIRSTFANSPKRLATWTFWIEKKYVKIASKLYNCPLLGLFDGSLKKIESFNMKIDWSTLFKSTSDCGYSKMLMCHLFLQTTATNYADVFPFSFYFPGAMLRHYLLPTSLITKSTIDSQWLIWISTNDPFAIRNEK